MRTLNKKLEQYQSVDPMVDMLTTNEHNDHSVLKKRERKRHAGRSRRFLNDKR